jgi:Protein of unknown function (DUF664)
VISVDDFLFYVDDALEGMLAIVEDLGDDMSNRRPGLPGANSPFAILTHCLGVMEFWGGHRISGREFERDRPAEFVASGKVSDLADRVRIQREKLAADLADFEPFDKPNGDIPEDDLAVPLGRTKGAVLVHIYEELAQHRGQMEITRDLLLCDWVRFA